MTYFNLQNAKIKAVAASVPDDVEYTTDYNDLFGEEHVRKFIISTGVQRRFTSHWALLRQICVVPLLKKY